MVGSRVYSTAVEEMASRATALEAIRRLIAAGLPDMVHWAEPSPGPLDSAILHDVPRLAIVTAGKIRFPFCVGGKRIERTLCRGEALFTPPDGWMKRGDGIGKPAAWLGFVFRPEYLRVLSARVEGENTARRWWYHTAAPLHAAGGLALHALTDLAHHSPARREAAGALLAQATLHLAADTVAHAPESRRGKAAGTFELVSEYVYEHFHEAISRESAARALRLHPNHVSRLFRTQTGCGFSEFLTRVRVDAARELLRREVSCTVAEAAYRCGFSDSGYFVKVFRHATGMTPGVYRTAGRGETRAERRLRP